MVFCLHQALGVRMLTENSEGDAVLRLVAQLSEYMHQMLEAIRDKYYHEGRVSF